MGFSQVKKINNNISRSLNELINSNWNKVDTRRYFYNDCVWDGNNRKYTGTNSNTRFYTIPINGYYTIRAYTGNYGSYGKIIGQFVKGEQLRIDINDAYFINISSTRHNINNFHVNLSFNANINGVGTGFVSALALGGGGAGAGWLSGGNAYVRCNNGIAVGGGGGCSDPNSTGAWIYGGAGGSAYTWGDNVYALGGGGGAGNTSSYGPGNGGKAFVNDEEVNTYCSYDNSQVLRSGRGYNGSNYNGGHGGVGGAGVYVSNVAKGYFSSGGQYNGGSGKSGCNVSGYGYFAGDFSYFSDKCSYGGFYGGWTLTNNYYCNGGIGRYGFGGSGYHGGYGQLKGGDGVYGGDGLNPGVGTTANGTAIRHKSIIHTLPAWNKGYSNSIVIIEYGVSKDNY